MTQHRLICAKCKAELVSPGKFCSECGSAQEEPVAEMIAAPAIQKPPAQSSVSVSNKLPDIRISRGLLAAAMLCFLLSFVTVSCGPQEVSLTGLQLVTGTTIGNEKLDAVPEAILALTFAGVALGLSFLKNKFVGLATAISSALGFISLILLKLKFDTAAAQSGGPIRVSIQSGFWLSLLCLGGATAVSGWLVARHLSSSQRLPSAVHTTLEMRPQHFEPLSSNKTQEIVHVNPPNEKNDLNE